MSDCCDLFPEEWKPVPGYEDYYLVSNHGRLLSLRAPVGWRKVPRLLKPGSSQGWLRVVLCKEGPKKVHAVHRLVLETFVSPCPEGLQCSHQDGVRGNNHVDNLRWETAKENSGKRAIHGTQTQGSVHGSAKLTERKVLRIKSLLARNVTLQEIADQYGVTDVTISCIKTNKTWKHVVLGVVEMPSKNLAIIEGFLGQDPELRYSREQKPFCTFSVGVSGRGKGGQQETSWFKCVCFGENAEMVAKTFLKGAAIHCEGPVKLETFTGKDGKERSSLQLTAFEVKHPEQREQQPQPKPVQTKADFPRTKDDEDLEVPF